MFAVVECFLLIHSTAASRVLSIYGNQNEYNLKYLQTWKGRKIIQGRNFIQFMGVGDFTIALSTYVAIGRSTKIVLRFLFVLNFCY